MPKKNLIKIPPNIFNKLKSIDSQYIVVGILKTFTKDYIVEGNLEHLDIYIDDGNLKIPNEIMPLDCQGKYSDKNINGYEIVRDDLPKETHYRTMEVPSYGSYYLTHTVNMPYEMYPRESVAPRLSTMKIECKNVSANQDKFAIKFEINEVLDKESETFEEDLLFCLNLMQENIYACSIFPSGSTYEDYIKTTQLSWEFLPPGVREDDIKRIFGNSKPSKEKILEIERRYDFLMSLNPKELLYGTSGLQRYFGAIIEDDLVVFENTRYGNAIYIMYNNWQELSTLSRIELMSGKYGSDFDRVVHTSKWEDKVKKLISEHVN